MIRIYCDSNVYRLLKPSSNQYNQIVFDYFQNIKQNAVMAFSEAHLDDLRTSVEAYRNEDLELMEKYTDNFFIQYNQISKEWDCLLATPQEAYNSQNYVAYDKALTSPFDFRNLIVDLGDFPGKEQICEIMDTFLQTPLATLGHADMSMVSDDRNKLLMDRMVPGYNSDITIGAFMQNMQPYLSKLLRDWREMDELRGHVTSYLNTEDYNYKNWGLAFNEQLEKTTVGKKFTEILRLMSSSNDKQDYWLQFQYAYSMLEMFGITEERAGNKRKRNNLMDLSKDCVHAFNAMSCDYFITNDKGLLVKSQILYHIFQVANTQIVKVDELDQFELAKPFDGSIANLIPYLRSLDNLVTEDENFLYYKIVDKFLHFFDMVATPKETINTYILYSSKDEGRNYMYKEILFVCNKIVALLNPKGFNDQIVSIEEISKPSPNVYLRVWHFRDATVALACEGEKSAFQLKIILR